MRYEKQSMVRSVSYGFARTQRVFHGLVSVVFDRSISTCISEQSLESPFMDMGSRGNFRNNHTAHRTRTTRQVDLVIVHPLYKYHEPCNLFVLSFTSSSSYHTFLNLHSAAFYKRCLTRSNSSHST